ncbi:MAG: hypothetical protein WBC04_00025 [Candidatus Acidiferrales bacterium]
MTKSDAILYATAPGGFPAEEALPVKLFDEITELRVRRPNVVEQEARRRRRRRQLTHDGRLVLVAVDHPARGVTQIRKDELAMGNRYQLLARTRRVFRDLLLDGVVATADILEELLLLSHIERKRDGRSFLDGRVLVGTMNRGGLAGAVFEMDDTFTGMTAERLAELRCDAGKMMFRLDTGDAASGRTVLGCADALNALRRHRLAAFLEVLGVEQKPDGGYHSLNNATTLIRNCGIASGLGESSAHVWLKLPYCQDFESVAAATTLPILLLGGPARESQKETLADFAAGMASSPRVRGAIIGRNLLFPVEGDPLPMCKALTELVHGKAKG